MTPLLIAGDYYGNPFASCHCEERSDVAISRCITKIAVEILTAGGFRMTGESIGSLVMVIFTLAAKGQGLVGAIR